MNENEEIIERFRKRFIVKGWDVRWKDLKMEIVIFRVINRVYNRRGRVDGGGIWIKVKRYKREWKNDYGEYYRNRMDWDDDGRWDFEVCEGDSGKKIMGKRWGIERNYYVDGGNGRNIVRIWRNGRVWGEERMDNEFIWDYVDRRFKNYSDDDGNENMEGEENWD